MPSGVMLLYREYESTDITGNFIIIAATDNASLNARIANDAPDTKYSGLILSIIRKLVR